ncbi:MAG TPA: DNA-binding response regulator [Chitinophagaceae bacterium]|nr:DNA-binding response regulator [Chitinophagaceae bacterium]
MQQKKISILIADDHLIYREGLKMMLSADPQFWIKGEVNNGKELLLRVKQVAPDIIITDIKMPFMDGIEATKKLCRTYPGIRIIALSSFSEDYLIIEMLEAGAQGFLVKGIGHDELSKAIRTVYHHKPYFSMEITEKISRIIAGKNQDKKNLRHISLTEMEKQIVKLICKELTNKEIAARLSVGKRTVESYRIRIMDKLGAKSVASIITYALKSDLIRPGF